MYSGAWCGGICLFLGFVCFSATPKALTLSEAALHVVWLTSNLRDSFVISSLFSSTYASPSAPIPNSWEDALSASREVEALGGDLSDQKPQRAGAEPMYTGRQMNTHETGIGLGSQLTLETKFKFY